MYEFHSRCLSVDVFPTCLAPRISKVFSLEIQPKSQVLGLYVVLDISS